MKILILADHQAIKIRDLAKVDIIIVHGHTRGGDDTYEIVKDREGTATLHVGALDG